MQGDERPGMPGGEAVSALRAQMAEAFAEMQQVADELREQSRSFLAEVDAERARLREARLRDEREYAEQAREGEAGRARAELQERIDREETSWRDVMSGVDQHWSAVEVREEIAGDARRQVDEIEMDDPELAERYREHATLRRGDRVGEWRD